jgi:PAB-dependent poly(A)-specific ribonuclease subunit 2
MFNDFHVKLLPTEEALAFNSTWKTPVVINYQLKEFDNKIDHTWVERLDTSLLYVDHK